LLEFVRLGILLRLFQVIPYVVEVLTGDKRGAVTDANVFIQMYGSDGLKSEELYLRNHSDNFFGVF
jgi:hypothetical protein